MKISAFDIRVGNLIEHQGKLWRVLKKNHVKPGKGGAFVQVELKETTQGTKLNERFRSADTVDQLVDAEVVAIIDGTFFIEVDIVHAGDIGGEAIRDAFDPRKAVTA